MHFKQTKLQDAYIIGMDLKQDSRGYFARAWCAEEMQAKNLNSKFVQSNMSANLKKGTVRGMHYQIEPFAEEKLVRCLRGSIFDVIVDLRQDSATRMQWFGIELSETNMQSLYIPKGFAHGFQTLMDDTLVLYHSTGFYSPEHERGINWDEPDININWPISDDIICSDKDNSWPSLTSVKKST